MGFLNNLLDKLHRRKETAGTKPNTDPAISHSSEQKKPEERKTVTYAHIDREFGDGFVFSSERMQVSKSQIDFFTSGIRHDMAEKHCRTNIAIFESTKYKTILRLSLDIPTFDAYDRECDSWHDLFLLQEHDGIIRAVYCTGGYSVAHVEGYSQVYQYPESLKKYFQDGLIENPPTSL